MIACNLCAMILQLVCQSQNYDWAAHPSMHSLLLILVRVVGGLGPVRGPMRDRQPFTFAHLHLWATWNHHLGLGL